MIADQPRITAHRRPATRRVMVGARLVLLLPLLLGACMAAPARLAPGALPLFSPLAFFDGPTEGSGQLRIATRRHRQKVDVHGNGHVEPDGTLVLQQRVDRPGKPAKTRVWHIRESAPGIVTGTLSDASGPVTGVATGNRLHLAFRSKGGLATQQWLTLAPDGQSARNIMIVRKMGMTVAILDETITRRPPPP